MKTYVVSGLVFPSDKTLPVHVLANDAQLKWVIEHSVMFNSHTRAAVILHQEIPASLFWLISIFAHRSDIIDLSKYWSLNSTRMVSEQLRHENRTLSVKIKDLEWKLLHYCGNKNLLFHQKLTKVKSQAIVFKRVLEFPKCLLGWGNGIHAWGAMGSFCLLKSVCFW